MTRTVDTRVLPIEAGNPDPAAIAAAADIIRAGGLVGFPTETVYGLGANATDAQAVAGIFRAKGRPANDPLIAHIADLTQLDECARDIPDKARNLCERLFPGPLTVVLRKSQRIPDNLSAGLDTVALRMPDHPVALALIRAAAKPIAAPSANAFSRPSPTTAQHVLDDLDGKVDLILDAGPARIGLESTIVSLVGDPPRLLRPGGVPLETLREWLPDLRFAPQFVDKNATVPAPGTMLKHYSPCASLLLFRGDDAAVHAAIRSEIARQVKVGLLLMDSDCQRLSDIDAPIFNLGVDSRQAAERLFAGLRALDKAGVDVILARAPHRQGLGLALYDRLLRAAVGRVIDTPPVL